MAVKKDWRYRELGKWIEGHKGNLFVDDKTVFLVNPKSIKTIDGLIEKHFWGAVQRALRGSGLRFAGDRFDLATINAEIATRCFNFIIEDPRRPLSNLPSGRGPPWYCRGTFECSPLAYMLSFDLYIDLPISFSINKIIGLLGDWRFRGGPPELSVEEHPTGKRLYHLAFHGGHGAGFLSETPKEAAWTVEKQIKINVEITKRLDELYKNLGNEVALERLKKALLEGYENC